MFGIMKRMAKRIGEMFFAPEREAPTYRITKGKGKWKGQTGLHMARARGYIR